MSRKLDDLTLLQVGSRDQIGRGAASQSVSARKISVGGKRMALADKRRERRLNRGGARFQLPDRLLNLLCALCDL